MRFFSARPPSRRQAREVVADGAVLPVSVVESARATRLTLRIVPGGKALKVTIPPHVSDKQVDQFIARNQNWIATRIARIPDPVEADSGALVPYLGIEHRIIHLDRLRGVVEAREVAGEPALLVPGEPSRVAGKLAAFLKARARTTQPCSGPALPVARGTRQDHSYHRHHQPLGIMLDNQDALFFLAYHHGTARSVGLPRSP